MDQTRFTLLLDVSSECVRLEYDVDHALPPEFLGLANMRPRWFGKNVRTELSGGLAAALKVFGNLHDLLPPAERTSIVLGICKDPMQDGLADFMNVLALLRCLQTRPPEKLLIQTRSPLILLLVPILKSFGDSVEVRMAYECVDDRSTNFYTPELARTSERLSAARALARANIRVCAQLLPIVSPKYSTNRLRKFARELAAASETVHLVDELRGEIRTPRAPLPISQSCKIFSELLTAEGSKIASQHVKEGNLVFREAA